MATVQQLQVPLQPSLPSAGVQHAVHVDFQRLQQEATALRAQLASMEQEKAGLQRALQSSTKAASPVASSQVHRQVSL